MQPTPKQPKTCLVTGATSGIGQVTATALARQGATVGIVGRDPARTDSNVSQIQRESDNPEVIGFVADLSSREQIVRLAEEVQTRLSRLDVLINNAGAIFNKRMLSVDDIEMTMALNHLSYFLLTHQLLEMLKSSAPARIVNVASAAHRHARLDFDDLQAQRRYRGWPVYCQSKLANILFTYSLAENLPDTQVTVNALHPGFVATNFGHNNRGIFRLMIRLAQRIAAISPAAGAQTTIYLASSPDVDRVTGKYFCNRQQVKSSPASYDSQTGKRLWRTSLEMTGLQE